MFSQQLGRVCLSQSWRLDSPLLGRGNVLPKGKQLSSKALVNLVTAGTHALGRAWKLSGGGVGMGGN